MSIAAYTNANMKPYINIIQKCCVKLENNLCHPLALHVQQLWAAGFMGQKIMWLPSHELVEDPKDNFKDSFDLISKITTTQHLHLH